MTRIYPLVYTRDMAEKGTKAYIHKDILKEIGIRAIKLGVSRLDLFRLLTQISMSELANLILVNKKKVPPEK